MISRCMDCKRFMIKCPCMGDKEEVEAASCCEYMQWISVKDHLPKEEETVLITDGTAVFCGYWYKISIEDIIWTHSDCGRWPGITHWMPLPEFPQ